MTRSLVSGRGARLASACVVLSLVLLTAGSSAARAADSGFRKPPVGGYFHLRPVGAWSKLPGDRACAARVHRSWWEPRRENWSPNHRMPGRGVVRASFAARKRSTGGAYARRWDTWLLPRVDGHFTGTTDQIFQWAACKWGLSDDLLRAIAVRESTWYNALHFANGSCYVDRGCGDIVGSATSETEVFCDMQATHGFDYQAQFGAGRCPETFSIAGVKAWQDPAWDRYPGNQNGTFPFARNSTAFALDYLGGELRGCFEGWERWLGDGPGGYGPGQIWGCVGAWYAGSWLSSGAKDYIAKVRTSQRTRPWRTAAFRTGQYHCDPVKGCPL